MRKALRAAEHVLTFHPEQLTPVFHRWGPHEYEGIVLPRGYEARFSEYRTPCGLLIDQHLWVEHNRPAYVSHTVQQHRTNPAWLRADNALRIGRLCKRCFPEGAG